MMLKLWPSLDLAAVLLHMLVIGLSWLLVIATFPFSLLVCLKVQPLALPSP